MKKLANQVEWILFLQLFVGFIAKANPQSIDGMYVNTFGKSNDPAIVFVHGGPGYNSADFEFTTAESLSNRGYYVVVYDERGQGRSADSDLSKFNYAQYSSDLKLIIDTLKLSHPTLLGHSHGGPIVIEFEKRYPNVADKVVLVSAPINFWETISSVHENCARKFVEKNDFTDLKTLGYVHQALFSSVAQSLSPEDFAFAIGWGFQQGTKNCGLYDVAASSPKRDQLRNMLRSAYPRVPMTGQITAITGFLKNENYVHLDHTDFVTNNQSRFCGIYGDEDGLFTPAVRAEIQASLDTDGQAERFALIRGASHDVFIDQQDIFFEALGSVCGLKNLTGDPK